MTTRGCTPRAIRSERQTCQRYYIRYEPAFVPGGIGEIRGEPYTNQALGYPPAGATVAEQEVVARTLYAVAMEQMKAGMRPRVTFTATVFGVGRSPRAGSKVAVDYTHIAADRDGPFIPLRITDSPADDGLWRVLKVERQYGAGMPMDTYTLSSSGQYGDATQAATGEQRDALAVKVTAQTQPFTSFLASSKYNIDAANPVPYSICIPPNTYGIDACWISVDFDYYQQPVTTRACYELCLTVFSGSISSQTSRISASFRPFSATTAPTGSRESAPSGGRATRCSKFITRSSENKAGTPIMTVGNVDVELPTPTDINLGGTFNTAGTGVTGTTDGFDLVQKGTDNDAVIVIPVTNDSTLTPLASNTLRVYQIAGSGSPGDFELKAQVVPNSAGGVKLNSTINFPTAKTKSTFTAPINKLVAAARSIIAHIPAGQVLGPLPDHIHPTLPDLTNLTQPTQIGLEVDNGDGIFVPASALVVDISTQQTGPWSSAFTVEVARLINRLGRKVRLRFFSVGNADNGRGAIIVSGTVQGSAGGLGQANVTQ